MGVWKPKKNDFQMLAPCCQAIEGFPTMCRECPQKVNDDERIQAHRAQVKRNSLLLQGSESSKQDFCQTKNQQH